MTTKKEEESKTTSEKKVIKKQEPKRVLYEVVKESTVPSFVKVGALSKAGLLIQFNDEKEKYGQYDLKPSISESEFDKIIKNFMGE